MAQEGKYLPGDVGSLRVGKDVLVQMLDDGNKVFEVFGGNIFIVVELVLEPQSDVLYRSRKIGSSLEENISN